MSVSICSTASVRALSTLCFCYCKVPHCRLYAEVADNLSEDHGSFPNGQRVTQIFFHDDRNLKSLNSTAFFRDLFDALAFV